LGQSVPILRYPGAEHGTPTGLASCGSVWACPVCSARILAARARRLSDVIAGWTARGHRVAMVTLTQSHRRSDSLRDCWDDVQRSLSWTLGGAWGHWCRDHGVMMQGPKGVRPRVPVVRAIEVLWSPEHGWHVHVHALVFLRDGDEALWRDMWQLLRARWVEASKRRGRVASALGQECHLVDDGTRAGTLVGEYLAKAVLSGDVAAEVARGDLKSYGGRRWTPWELLELVSSGQHPEKEAQVQALWREWEQVSRGRRQMIISTGLAEYVGAGTVPESDADALAQTDERDDAWGPADNLSLIGQPARRM
jgi:hypothetical protein